LAGCPNKATKEQISAYAATNGDALIMAIPSTFSLLISSTTQELRVVKDSQKVERGKWTGKQQLEGDPWG
jgi:hypothetical protein